MGMYLMAASFKSQVLKSNLVINGSMYINSFFFVGSFSSMSKGINFSAISFFFSFFFKLINFCSKLLIEIRYVSK